MISSAHDRIDQPEGAVSARVLPFPLSRRRDLIRRQAQWFSAQPARAAERNLQHQLGVQLEALRRKGVDDETANAEVVALEGAIRAEVWWVILSGGGAA